MVETPLSNASCPRIVVGLGNPGSKYDGTRHNVGFEVLNTLQQRHAAAPPKSKFEGQVLDIHIKGQKTILVWPLTFMNLSGRCVQATTKFFKTDPERDLLIICDDLSLPVGKLRIRSKGSAGGQKGLANILKCFGTQSVPRLRVGIGQQPERWDAADYVLGKFDREERDVIRESIERAADAVELWLLEGIDYCMNRVNSR